MILALTGHRPNKLGPVENITNALPDIYDELNPEIVICGMADGFDLLAGSCAVDKGFPVVAARPWKEHKSTKYNDLYEKIMDDAVSIVTLSSTFHKGVYQIRNEYMVNNCEEILAAWNGLEGGGTWQTIKYGRALSRPIHVFNTVTGCYEG